MSLLKSRPTKGRKRGNPWQGCSRRAARKPLGKTLNWSNWLGRHNSKHSTQTMTMRGPMTSPHLQGDGHLCWPSGLWCSWGSAGVDWLKRPLGHSLRGKKFPKGHPFLLGGASHQITQDNGCKRNPFPWGPEMVKWSVLLPVVWERGAEWRHSGKPPANDPLPPGPNLQPVLRILHNQHWDYAPSLAAVQASTGWHWWWPEGGIWHRR